MGTQVGKAKITLGGKVLQRDTGAEVVVSQKRFDPILGSFESGKRSPDSWSTGGEEPF